MSQTPKSTRWSSVIWVILLGWGFSILLRLTYVPFVQVTSDTLSPFVAGVRWWNTGVFEPANPESDQWLWMVSFPLTWLAGDLSSLFWWKVVASTLLIPVALWTLKQQISQHRSFWLGILAVILTLDMGLVDTTLSSFRGYWAPECMALACLGLVQWERSQRHAERWAHWASVWTVIAMGQHPLVLGCLPALIWLWYSMAQREQRWWVSLLLVCVVSIPRGVWLWELMQCDAGGLDCLTSVAVSSSESVSSLDLLVRALTDRLWVEMGLGSLLMIGGWIASKDKVLKSWLLYSVIGIVLLGLLVSTLRPYHFRVLIVPMFLLAIEGWSRIGKIGYAVGVAWVISVIIFRIEPVEWYNTANEVDEAATALCQQAHSEVWLEGYGIELKISPQSVGLSLYLTGCGVSFSSSPTTTIWLVETVSDPAPLNGEVRWSSESHQLREVDWTSWQTLPKDAQWSGHDVAILYWLPEAVQLQ